MEIITANFKKNPEDVRSLHILFEDEEGTQRWTSVSETSDRFSTARKLFAKYSQATDSDEEHLIASEIIELIDVKQRIRRALSAPTAGVFTIKNKVVYYNNEPLNDHLSSHIIRMFRDDSSPRDERIWSSFAKFVENLQQNTDEFVREQLFSWLATMQSVHGSFTITEDGHFLAYKGCPVEKDGVAYSGQVGNASVLKNGEITDFKNSRIPNEIGTTVMMKRSEVESNPKIACAPGLHFATLEFARSYSRDGNIFLLKVHPRDVVAIPTDSNAQKGRCSKYQIIDKVQKSLSKGLYLTDDSTEGDFESSDIVEDKNTSNNDSSQSSGENMYNMTNEQRGAIFGGLENIGIHRWERTRALNWLSNFLGRTVDSRKNMTHDEADRVIQELHKA